VVAVLNKADASQDESFDDGDWHGGSEKRAHDTRDVFVWKFMASE
jgi:hypothetical protein